MDIAPTLHGANRNFCVTTTTIPRFCQPFCTFLTTHVTLDVELQVYVYVAKRHVVFDFVAPLQKSKFHRRACFEPISGIL